MLVKNHNICPNVAWSMSLIDCVDLINSEQEDAQDLDLITYKMLVKHRKKNGVSSI